MNERIKELAEQAELNLYREIGTGKLDEDGNFETRKELHPIVQHFAELIIKECTDICKNLYVAGEYRDIATDCANEIEERFGVE